MLAPKCQVSTTAIWASRTNTFASEVPLFLMSGIQKFDYQELKEVDRFDLPEGKFMGQPVFAPRIGSEAEDDGYLIAYVGNLEETEVWIWRGQSIGAGPVARVQLPLVVPAGSHACWGSGEDIRAAQARRRQAVA